MKIIMKNQMKLFIEYYIKINKIFINIILIVKKRKKKLIKYGLVK